MVCQAAERANDPWPVSWNAIAGTDPSLSLVEHDLVNHAIVGDRERDVRAQRREQRLERVCGHTPHDRAAVALAVIAIRIGHPTVAPATCGPAPDPPTTWWSHERADGGKPTAEALHDPAAAIDPASPPIDPAVCHPPPAPGR